MQRKSPEVTVSTDERGMPCDLTQKSVRRKVISIYDHWRIVDSWWADEVKRDYFTVELSNASICNIYHDMIADRWYLARKYG